MNDFSKFLKSVDLSGMSVEQILAMIPVLKVLPLPKKIKEQLLDVERQAKNLIATKQQAYNVDAQLLDRGWFVHKNLDIETIQQANTMCSTGNLLAAEEVFCDFFLDKIDEDINRLGIHARNVGWRKYLDPRSKKTLRQEQEKDADYSGNMYAQNINRAYENTRKGCYAEATLLMLPIIDGMTSKFLITSGTDRETIFSNNSREKLTPEAEQAIKTVAPNFWEALDIIAETRSRYSAEEITIPYRNGIMHGTDVNFNNKFVVCKCWALLLTVDEVMKAISDAEYQRTVAKKSPAESKKETQRLVEDSETFVPRDKLAITGDGNFETQQFEKNTPEYALQKFFTGWKNKNYRDVAMIASVITQSKSMPDDQRRDLHSVIQEMKEQLDDYDLISCTFKPDIWESLAQTKISCEVTFLNRFYESPEQKTGVFEFILNCQETDFFDTVSRYDENAVWQLHLNSLSFLYS
ncbi:MAG: hypothetical protein F4X51_18350 [Gemmatimonadetes bacterium]|nr:hypothetical protein [Gemmatimonadota bacterium]